MVTTRVFDANRGFVTGVTAGPSYAFDTIGNLTQRADATQSLTENFTYDVLNRLTSYAIVGGTTKTMSYNDIGNIMSKSDVGGYTYAAAGNPRPHAVRAAGAEAYAYDGNGNMISGAGRTIGWTAFNKVASISQGTINLSWAYGPERQRIKQVSSAGATYYYGGFEKLVGATVTQWNHYLFAGGDMVGVISPLWRQQIHRWAD